MMVDLREQALEVTKLIALREQAEEASDKIIEICGESAAHVTEQQKRDAEDYIFGLLMEARGRGIRARVMDRVRDRGRVETA